MSECVIKSGKLYLGQCPRLDNARFSGTLTQAECLEVLGSEKSDIKARRKFNLRVKRFYKRIFFFFGEIVGWNKEIRVRFGTNSWALKHPLQQGFSNLLHF